MDIGNKGKEVSTSYPLIGNILEMLHEDGVVEYLSDEKKYQLRNP